MSERTWKNERRFAAQYSRSIILLHRRRDSYIEGT
jgi:hypothetical protein